MKLKKHNRYSYSPIIERNDFTWPGGKRIALLKTLLTSACERDCYYCPFRAGRDFRRATFKPQEFAELVRTECDEITGKNR